MFGGKARQYPNLVSYLHQLSRRPEPSVGSIDLRTAATLAGGWLACSGVAVMIDRVFLALPAAIVAVGLGALSTRRRPPELTAREQRREEARQVGETMKRCLDLRRLHRDLDEGSLAVLEECSRHWARVQAVFSTGFWSDAHLPSAYAGARQQALDAADDAMHDVLILYAPCLPNEVKGRQPLDYVEEALEQYVFKGPTNPSHPPAAFVPARQIADRLRSLADEAEQIASDLNRERVQAPTATSGSLDASLSELRAIREAEDELRQNLRG